MGGEEGLRNVRCESARIKIYVSQGVTFMNCLISFVLHVCAECASVSDTLLSAPLNVTISEIEVNSAVVTWETLEGDPVIGFAITQQVPPCMM